ncbi:MAG: DUF4342 domain-containing protein [Clostridium sp.]|nr:DUF4342 domain-containing protein [Clostridium sp.]
MSEITLEKLDQIIERTNVTYGEAKKALEQSEGNVIDAIIYIEENFNTKSKKTKKEEKNEVFQDVKSWIMDLVEKGNVARIAIKKDDKVVVDVPVNAGIAATVIAITIPPILAAALVAAVATKITIEITMTDGSVQVVNKVISDAKDGVKEKATSIADFFKEKYSDLKKDEDMYYDDDYTMYSATFTQKFDDNEEDIDEDFSNSEQK